MDRERYRKPRLWVTALAAMLCVAVLAACAVNPGGEKGNKHPVPSGTIVYYTQLDQAPDLYYASHADKVISGLIDDYDVMTTDPHGKYVVNESVCKAMEVVENSDGSHTVTVTLQEGLTYSTGEPITAVDYLVSALIDFSPAANENGDFTRQQAVYLNSQRAPYFAGAAAYMAGEADTISGLKLIDDDTYSVTIPAEAVELYYDCANVSLRPLSAALFGASVTVDGDRVTLTGLTQEGMNVGRTTNVGRVCAGPYLIESYDEAAQRLVLRVNEHYAGNYEGQFPGVETIVVENADWNQVYYREMPEEDVGYFPNEWWFDADATQRYQVHADAGFMTAASYGRNGYGYLIFQCDMGPTRFRAVRQAITCLVDRQAYAEAFCQGYGAVVHGPYVPSRWEYRENAKELDKELDPYAYDPARAVKLLEEDGWVLSEDGSPYVSGVRYKQVTPEEAGDYPYNVTLPDGRILMPLIIDRANSESGSVFDPLVPYFDENQTMIDAGMQVNSRDLPFSTLLDYLYRNEEGYDEWAGPNTYGLYGLAKALQPKNDFSLDFTEEGTLFHDYDENLARLSRQMLQAKDDATYAELWRDFILAWNEELPMIPLYQNIYYDFMDPHIKGLTPDTYWPFERAVLYATVEE